MLEQSMELPSQRKVQAGKERTKKGVWGLEGRW